MERVGGLLGGRFVTYSSSITANSPPTAITGCIWRKSFSLCIWHRLQTRQVFDARGSLWVQPAQLDLAYGERSMWIVLSKLFPGVNDMNTETFRPIKNVEYASEEIIQKYKELSLKVLSNGICIWDVLSNCHDKNYIELKRRKRSKVNYEAESPNPLDVFVTQHPSIKVVAFIGRRAYKTFQRHFIKNKSRGKDYIFDQFKFIVLTSSSPSNTKSTVEEKYLEWKSALEQYILLGD